MQEIEWVKELLQMLELLLSWKVLLPTVFATSALQFLLRLPIVGIILSPMNETITGTLGWLWVTSMLLLLYKAFYSAIMKLKDSIERKAREQAEQKAIADKLSSLSERERKILDYVKSGNNCGVWVSNKDAGVHTLIHKGLLERIGDARQFHDWEGERETCILVMLSPTMKIMKS